MKWAFGSKAISKRCYISRGLDQTNQSLRTREAEQIWQTIKEDFKENAKFKQKLPLWGGNFKTRSMLKVKFKKHLQSSKERSTQVQRQGKEQIE